MNRESYYEVLGLKPHASAEELKNAYRDLAKVWHPDRFTHDPRLQRKAQEKLKEINEAYTELTTGGRTRRPHRPPPPSPPASRRQSGPSSVPHVVIVRERRSNVWPFALAFVAFVFGVALFAGYRLMKGTPAPDASRPQASNDLAAGDAQTEETGAGGERREKKSNAKQKHDEETPVAAAPRQSETLPDAPADTAAAATLRRLPTVNRTIDPTTGMLAARACPLKLLRTYPAGQEPQQYCTADHTSKRASKETAPAQLDVLVPAPAPPTEPAGKSRLKSALGTVVSPGRWFRKKKERSAAETESVSGGG